LRRDSRKPYHWGVSGSTLTGVCLNSGSPEIGSVAGFTTASMQPLLPNWSFQCIGTNTEPGRCESTTRTRALDWPHFDVTRASEPSATAKLAASCG